MYLDTYEKLDTFVQRAACSSVLAIDTEFIREKTYYPQLCLLQMATYDEAVIIDPIAVSDLTPLKSLLEDPAIMKVFHAGSQDCAIIYDELGFVPISIFDTQVAAGFLGAPQQISLANLVKEYCRVRLDKSDSFTDWRQRPLSDRQVKYALADVRYLPGIYRSMTEKLEARGRLSWLTEELRRMSDVESYRLDESALWQKVKRTQSLPPSQLVLVQAIALWREKTAQKKDYPRRWILSDEQIVEIVKRNPDSIADLCEIRGIREKLGQSWAHQVLAALAQARTVPEKDWPTHKQRPPKSFESAASIDLLIALVRQRAEEHQISMPMLATRDELVRLVSGDYENLSVLTGWRKEIVGSELLNLLAGEVLLSLDKGKLKIAKAKGALEQT